MAKTSLLSGVQWGLYNGMHLTNNMYQYVTGWWFGTFLFFHILGMSSSQLTKSMIFQRGWNHQPDMFCRAQLTGNPSGNMDNLITWVPQWESPTPTMVYLVDNSRCFILVDPTVHRPKKEATGNGLQEVSKSIPTWLVVSNMNYFP